MQTLDIEAYKNSSGWHVEHGTDGFYYVSSEKGHRLHGVFTQRNFAESHLRKYMEDIVSSKPKSKKMKAVARTPAKD